MISDSIPNAAIPMASSNPKDFAKRKRANRMAKLKQCKLDARREQWLSQVKNKGGCKEQVIGEMDAQEGPLVHVENKGRCQIEKLEIKQRPGEDMNHYSDSDFSSSNSPTSHASSALGSNLSGVNFTASSRSNSSRSSSSCSNGCYSESASDEDEGDVGDDGCLDDWEVMADALAASDNKQQSPPLGKHGNNQHSDPQLDVVNQPYSTVDLKSESAGMGTQRASWKGHAWRPDDAFRPESLPTLSKQYSFPLNSEQHFGSGGSVWGRKNVGPIPTSCPICCEDLDVTDSSFLPCLCGFRLCLFCHKRILEQDARCPGCRKKYESEPVE